MKNVIENIDYIVGGFITGGVVVLFITSLFGCVNGPESVPPPPACTREIVNICFSYYANDLKLCGYKNPEECLTHNRGGDLIGQCGIEIFRQVCE